LNLEIIIGFTTGDDDFLPIYHIPQKICAWTL